MKERHPHSTANGPESVVMIDGLKKSYGSHVAVDDVSFDVRRGEIFGILGTNGAGKTTSVECAQGLRRPDGGTVRVLGHDPLTDGRQLRGRVGSQLQESRLPDRLRVGEALRLFADDPAKAEAALADWELVSLAKAAFADLSGGQRQRLFLALALMNKPELVFLDELTQGLDPNARRAVWGLIEQARDQGTTVVLVTHFMEEAEVLCDRVLVMVDGRAIDRGTPQELIERHSPGVRIRFPRDGHDLGWIDAVTGVDSVRDVGSDVEVVGASSSLAYLGAELVRRNLVPPSLRVDQPNLEDALLDLITPQGVSS